MIERICPQCGGGNPERQAYCGDCGAALQPQPLTRRPAAALARRSVQIPARWRETGKVVALGLAAVAAEAGIALLNRRQNAAPHPLARPPQPSGRVIAVGHRISQTWHNGQLQHRTEERVVWIAPDQPGQ